MLWNITNIGVLASISSFVPVTIPSTLTNSLCAFYNFNDTILDNSGNNLNFTAVGSPAYGTGINGNSFNRNSSTYIVNNNNFDFSGAFTISFWVNLSAIANEIQGFIHGAGLNNIGIYYTPVVIFDGQGESTAPPFGNLYISNVGFSHDTFRMPYIIPNTWRHIVMTRDTTSTRVSAFVDGVLCPTTWTEGVNDYSSSSLTVGNGTGFASTQAMSGRIDNLGIWNRALTPTEISALYNNGNGLEYPFPVSLPVTSGLAYSILTQLGNSVFTYTSNLTSIFPAGNVPTILLADSGMPYQFYRINNPFGPTFLTFDRTTTQILSTFRLQTDFRIFGGADALWISCYNTEHHGSTGFVSASSVQGLDSLRGTSGGVRGALSVYVPAGCCNDGQIRFWYSPSITGNQTMIGTFTPFNPRDGNPHRLITRYNFSGTTLITNITAIQNCNSALSAIFTTSFTTTNPTISAFNPRVGYLGLTGGIQGNKDVGNIIFSYR